MSTKRDLSSFFFMLPSNGEEEEMYKLYKSQEANTWSVNDLCFREDRVDYETKLTPKQRRIIDKILCFFLPSDGMVNDNLALNFYRECDFKFERAFLVSQMNIEVVHAEGYSLAFSIYSEDRIKELYAEIENSEYLKKKFDFITKWTESTQPLTVRLFAFTCIEGIFFQTLFAFIFWFKKLNVLPGLMFLNEEIMPDETLHADGGAHMHKRRGKIPIALAKEITAEVFQIESIFIDWIMGIVKETYETKDEHEDEVLDGLTAEDMKEFLKVVVNRNMHRNDYPPEFPDVKIPEGMTWMENLSLRRKHNTFEGKGASYTRSSINDAVNWRARVASSEEYKELEKALTSPLDIDF